MVGNDCLGIDIINLRSSAKAETLSNLLPSSGLGNVMWFVDSIVGGLMLNILIMYVNHSTTPKGVIKMVL